MTRYKMSREQAEAYAKRLMKSDAPPENRIRVEAAQQYIAPHVERATRIHRFNALNGRYMAGETLEMEELQYLNRVKEAEAKRIRGEAQAMVASKKLAGVVAPAANAMLDRARPRPPVELEIGPVQMAPQYDLEVGPVQLDPLDPDVERLRTWDDPAAAARRRENAWYWRSERGRERLAEIQALRKRVTSKKR